MGSGHGYIVDETESTRGILTTVVTRGAHNTESPSRGGWSCLEMVTSTRNDGVNGFANRPQRSLNGI